MSALTHTTCLRTHYVCTNILQLFGDYLLHTAGYSPNAVCKQTCFQASAHYVDGRRHRKINILNSKNLTEWLFIACLAQQLFKNTLILVNFLNIHSL